MIVEYDSKYDEQIKDLLVELQEYIVKIDKEGFNIITDEYREKYFQKTLDEIKEHNGKMLLFKQDKIVGLVVGLVDEPINDYDFRAPKRGRVSELIVSKNCRAKGIGKSLLNSIEQYFKECGCKNVLIEVFGYNENAISFYEKHGYHTRTIYTTKNL